MRCLGERWSAFKDGAGPARHSRGQVSSIAAGLVHIANVLHKPEIVPFPLPWVIATAVVAVSLARSMVEYPVKLRGPSRALSIRRKLSIRCRNILMTLTIRFSTRAYQAKQSTELGGCSGTSGTKKSENHLQSKLGLRERNLFRNIVLYQPVTIPHKFSAPHNLDLNFLYRQLETIRDTVIRHSERQWRIRGLKQKS